MLPKYTHPILRICVFLLASIVAPSCGEQKSADQPAERLAELRAKYAEIGKEIKALEAELSKADSSDGSGRLVVTEAIETGSFTTFIEVQGRVDARQNVEVTAEAMGIIRSVKVKTGDVVRKGAV